MEIDNKILEELDLELKQMHLPFNKGLPILQKKLNNIATKLNLDATDVLNQYLKWKAKKINS